MKTQMKMLGCWLCLLGLVSCIDLRPEDENGDPIDSLPPKSHVGINSLGFMLNGNEVWLAQGGGLGNPTFDKSMGASGFYVAGQRRFERTNEKAEEVFWFVISRKDSSNIFEVQTPYKIDLEKDFVSFQWRDWYDECTICEEPCEDDFITLQDVDVTLTYMSHEKRIASGEFSLTLIVAECDTLTITDGRFDISFN